MNNNSFLDIIRLCIANVGWWIYVKAKWVHNKQVQEKLTGTIRDNLGYYLREGHNDFKD